MPATSPAFVLGLDLGGTSVKAVAVQPDGHELLRDHQPFDLSVPFAFADAVDAVARRLEQRLDAKALAVGLSAPGIAAPDHRSIAFMPDRFPGLPGLVWAERLARDQVWVLNDAQAALLGEVWLGAARGARHALLLTLGTGVGGAAMVDGRLLRGFMGKAGHLGHCSLDPEGPLDITGTPGSLEDAIGNHNIAVRSHGRFPTTLDLVRAHQAGDPDASAVWAKSVKALAAAIASFTNLLDPEVVIVGGGIAGCGESLFNPLRAWMDRFEWRIQGAQTRIVPAALGDLAGAFGAAWNAFRSRTAGPDSPPDPEVPTP